MEEQPFQKLSYEKMFYFSRNSDTQHNDVTWSYETVKHATFISFLS